MTGTVRSALVERLVTDVGAAFERDDHEDLWMIAHVALRAVEWVLDAAGLGPDEPTYSVLWRLLGRNDTVDALADAHWSHALRWVADDEVDWPLPMDTYIGLVEEALDVNLARLVVRSPVRLHAASRFGAPLADDAVACIHAQTTEYMGRLDPVHWLVQRRVGRCSRTSDLTAELDRFVAHWSYRRDLPNAWMEVDRNEAVDVIVALQRTSLVRGPHRDRKLDDARARAVQFLACFNDNDRYFTNGCAFHDGRLATWQFRITDAMFDAGVVAIDSRHAGIWWHGEGDRNTPLGVSP